MNYKLINPIKQENTIEQILYNRGIKEEDFYHYLNTTDDDINSPLLFGADVIRKAAQVLLNTIKRNLDIMIIVDSDCDGYTSSALLINFLYRLAPAYVENHLSQFLHSGKQHGLNDCYEDLASSNISLVICPDSSSNDQEAHRFLFERGITTLILDHHDAPYISEQAITINNQLSDYPNKFLSGVGVTWQFCRYINEEIANSFLDLVATGLDGDMMSLRSIETKHLIQKGLKSINNPFLAGMVDKNSFSLGNELTPIGVAFYIVPYINAMVRSGTQEEKKLVFESMLSFKAYKQIPSNKRGHKEGEMETILDQALRTVTNVKNRQTKSVTAGMELLENKIEKENLLSNKVLLFLLEPGEISPNVAGLAANKIMAKYQRPCCVLTKTTNIIYAEDNSENKLKSLPIVSYQGSSRGCDIVGVSDFKGVCEQTQTQNYCTGHPGAFGLSIDATKIEEFKEKTDELLKNMPDTASYYVDYIFQGYNVDEHKIQEIAALSNLYGKDLDEPFVAIENLKVTPDMVTIYDKKGFTLKITLPNGINLMKFKATEEDCNIFQDNELLKINIIGKCNINEYMGKITPQIFIENQDIISQSKYYF